MELGGSWRTTGLLSRSEKKSTMVDVNGHDVIGVKRLEKMRPEQHQDTLVGKSRFLLSTEGVGGGGGRSLGILLHCSQGRSSDDNQGPTSNLTSVLQYYGYIVVGYVHIFNVQQSLGKKLSFAHYNSKF